MHTPSTEHVGKFPKMVVPAQGQVEVDVHNAL